jgi:peroxiredoxin
MIIITMFFVAGSVYLVTAGSSRPPSEPAVDVSPGNEAPNFQLEDNRGNVVTLSSLRGKVVMLNFWATWCPPCRAEMPSMEKLNQAMSGEDFVILAVNIEANGRSTVAEFLEKTPHSFPVLFDEQGDVQKLYGVYKFPESFVITKDGIIDDKVIGAIDWAHPETIAYFKELTKG